MDALAILLPERGERDFRDRHVDGKPDGGVGGANVGANRDSRGGQRGGEHCNTLHVFNYSFGRFAWRARVTMGDSGARFQVDESFQTGMSASIPAGMGAFCA